MGIMMLLLMMMMMMTMLMNNDSYSFYGFLSLECHSKRILMNNGCKLGPQNRFVQWSGTLQELFEEVPLLRRTMFFSI